MNTSISFSDDGSIFHGNENVSIVTFLIFDTSVLDFKWVGVPSFMYMYAEKCLEEGGHIIKDNSAICRRLLKGEQFIYEHLSHAEAYEIGDFVKSGMFLNAKDEQDLIEEEKRDTQEFNEFWNDNNGGRNE